MDKKVKIFWIIPVFLIPFVFINFDFFKFLILHPSNFTKESLLHTITNFILFPLLFLTIISGLVSLGNKILKFYNFESFVFSYAVGVGVLIYVIFLLSVFGVLHKSIMFLILIILISLSLPYLKKIKSLLVAIGNINISPVFILLGVLVLLAVSYGFLNAIAPPTEHDSLAYHLAIPKLWIKHGGMFYVPWLTANWPYNSEMLFLFGLSLGSDILPQLFNFANVLITAGILYSFSKKYFCEQVAWLSVLLFLTMRIVVINSGVAGSDFTLGMFALAAIYAFWNYKNEDKTPWLVLSAVMAALSAGCKYNGLLIILIIGLYIVIFIKSQKLKILFRFCLISIVVASPWYIRNYIMTGNPVWPFIFGEKDWNPVAGREFFLRSIIPGTSFLINDFKSFFKYFIINNNLKYEPQYFVISFLLVFIIFIIFKKIKVDLIIKSLILYIFINCVLFFNQIEIWRLLIPAHPLLCLILSWMIIALYKSGKKITVLLLCFSIFSSVNMKSTIELFYAFGIKSQVNPAISPKERYLDITSTIYPISRYINENLPENSKVLLFNETRGYYIDKEYLWGDCGNQGIINYYELRDLKELRAKLSKLKITHILVKNKGIGCSQYESYVFNLMNDFIKKYCRVNKEDNRFVLYEIKT
ncbi:MAG: glycosyltransferase family 39 protein [Elusimicrobia bacterium]|nr:glycosyltransferase family 39 protein [Elusimicrobiota bacterium]